MLPVIHLGLLALQFPGLILLIGLWLGLELTERQADVYNLPRVQLSTLMLVSLGAGLVGARVVFAAQNPALFEDGPLSLLSLSPQLLSLPGGFISGLVAGVAYAQRRQIARIATLDALTTLFGLMMLSIHAANFASGDAYGLPANVPWAVDLWGAARHPVQAYEGLTALAILALLWPWKPSPLFNWLQARPGARFWAFLAATAFAHLLFEYFHAESQLIAGQVRLVQIVAWLILALSMWNLNRLFPSGQPALPPAEPS